MEPVEPKRVLYSYYTAGSGGVGPTILETSLLLAGTPVTVYANGEKVSTSMVPREERKPLIWSAALAGWGTGSQLSAYLPCQQALVDREHDDCRLPVRHVRAVESCRDC